LKKDGVEKTSAQQRVSVMWGFGVGIKSIFLISFSNGGQFGDGRA
jgi:hypothetical protein